MPFFVQRQNNSGGHFIGPQVVIIEADTIEKAIKKFKSKKRRFSTDSQYWCECCGERWDFDGYGFIEVATLEDAFELSGFFAPDENDFSLVFFKDKTVFVFTAKQGKGLSVPADPDSLTQIDKNDPRVTG